MSKKIRAVVYTRVSTNKDEQKHSFNEQKRYYEEYCERKGYKLVRIYADEGLTGTNNKRKEFLEMIYDGGINYHSGIEDKNVIHFEKSKREAKFDLIITKDVSRFARNVDSKVIANYLDEKGVSIHFENTSLKTGQGNWHFELTLYLTFAENESRDRSKKIKWSKERLREQGKFHFARVPFGYCFDKETDSYVIKEDEAGAVKRMFEMYVNENKGFRLIAQWCREQGLINRTAKNNSPKWHESTINRMMENEVYIGNVIVGKYTKHDVVSNGRIKIEENEWKRLENVIPAIIEPELFYAAQEVRKQRRAKAHDNSVKGIKISEGDIFARKIICSKCGSHFTRVMNYKKDSEGNKIKQYNYFCYNRRKYGSCDMRGISYNVLEREILKAVEKLKGEYRKASLSSEMKYKNDLLSWLEEKERSAAKEIEKLKKEISTVDEEIDNIAQQFLNANFVMQGALNKKIEKLDAEKQKVVQKLDSYNLVEIKHKRDEIKQQYNRVLEAVNKNYSSIEEIAETIDAIEIKEGRQFTIWFTVESLMGMYTKESQKREGQEIEQELSIIFDVEVKY